MFHFRQFSLSDENAAMKVGTDAVLLGAWIELQAAESILDIGTGTGIIALMMAQRSETLIDAIEIDGPAAEQAVLNARRSPWKERIKVHNIAFQQFAENCQSKFDVIVSNPPYFSRSLKAPDATRSLARHDDALPVGELMSGAAVLLKDTGSLNLIFPWYAFEAWEKTATLNGLFARRIMQVFPREGKPAGRAMVEFRKEYGTVSHENLFIRNLEGNYTDSYKKLTFDFYLGL